MAKLVQCENCGALLVEKDVFCGECGAPRPKTAGQPDAGPEDQPQMLNVAPEPGAHPGPPAAASDNARTGWLAAVVVLVVLGVIVCLVGLVAFVLFGSIPGEDMTPAEDWLYSAMCCLLPIGGSGAVLIIVGIVLWFTRLRNR